VSRSRCGWLLLASFDTAEDLYLRVAQPDPGAPAPGAQGAAQLRSGLAERSIDAGPQDDSRHESSETGGTLLACEHCERNAGGPHPTRGESWHDLLTRLDKTVLRAVVEGRIIDELHL
jgi:hypothetical protein